MANILLGIVIGVGLAKLIDLLILMYKERRIQ